MKGIAIIVGAGRGVRMNRSTPKQYLLLQQVPILVYSIRAFNACRDVHQIILVVPPGDIRYCSEKILALVDMKKPVQVIAGGERRQDSVRNGLLAIDNKESIVVIHDGVRPFIAPRHISACIAGTAETGACILAIPVSDTLMAVNGDFRIDATVSREGLWLAQTPQAFHYKNVMSAHESAGREGFSCTDDAALVERMGIQVRVIHGSRRNIKITNPEDLAMAEALLRPDIE
jgi:2-C-methyl-D-erythritol 4-phosphate cytidylyltransferase